MLDDGTGDEIAVESQWDTTEKDPQQEPFEVNVFSEVEDRYFRHTH